MRSQIGLSCVYLAMIVSIDPNETIGILAPGEMGTALAKTFRENGCRVVTAVDERSRRTRDLVAAAKLEVLPSMAEVVQASSILISTPPPNHAVELCRRVVDLAPTPGTIYIDANSVAPRTLNEINQIASQAKLNLVDMAIRGLARHLAQRGAIYLSGHDCERLVPLLRPIEVEILGIEPGAASLLKMLMGGLSKSIATLVMELGVAAQHAGIQERFLVGLKRYYPDVFSAMESILPTYPQHAERRSHELAEVEICLSDLAVQSEMISGGKRVLQSLAGTQIGKSADKLISGSVQDNLEAIARENSFLSLSSSQQQANPLPEALHAPSATAKN